jgi:hypothetical protein
VRSPERSNPAPWVLQLFGDVRVHRNGETIRLAPKEILLLALLAMSVERRLNRQTLINLMWDAGNEQVLRRRLSQACFSLRTRLRPLNPVLSEGDHLCLNPEVIRTELEVVEAAAKTGDLSTIEDTLTRRLVVPVHWPPDDVRVRQWLIPVLTLRSRILSRYLARHPDSQPMTDVLRVWSSFADLVVRLRGFEGISRVLHSQRDSEVGDGLETWRRFLTRGVIRALKDGNEGGFAQFFTLVSRTRVLLPSPHRASPGFLGLWSLRAHWEEGTGGGRDALEAMRALRARREMAPMAEMLALTLPVFEVEGMLGATPWHLEIMQEVERVVIGRSDSPGDACHVNLVRALVIRWRLANARLKGGPSRRLRDEIYELQSEGDDDVWLICQEALALGAFRGGRHDEAGMYFSSLLERAVSNGDVQTIGMAVGGLLSTGTVAIGEPERAWFEQTLAGRWLGRRARAFLELGRRRWAQRAHSVPQHLRGDLDRRGP